MYCYRPTLASPFFHLFHTCFRLGARVNNLDHQNALASRHLQIATQGSTGRLVAELAPFRSLGAMSGRG